MQRKRAIAISIEQAVPRDRLLLSAALLLPALLLLLISP